MMAPGAEDLDLLHLAPAELLLDGLDEDDGREDLVLGFLDDLLLGARGGATQGDARAGAASRFSCGNCLPRVAGCQRTGDRVEL
jgi:hypothetical protein